MSMWVQCTSCGLKHRERDDGLCPRCRQAAINVYAPPSAPMAPPSAPKPGPAQGEVSLGARLGGVFLVVNGLLVAYESYALPSEGMSSGIGRNSFVFDLIIGVSLALGYRKLLGLAILRVVLGAIVFTGMNLAGGDVGTAVFQVLLSATFLGLLIGNAGRVRTAFCSFLFVAYCGLTGLGLFVMETGDNPLTRKVMELTGDADPVAEDGIVYGTGFDYLLEVPNDRWLQRRSETFTQENPLADCWLVQPEKDAHVLVIGEQVGADQYVDMDSYAANVVENLRSGTSDLEILTHEGLINTWPRSRIVHARGTTEGMKIEYLCGLFTRNNLAFQVFTFAPQESFSAVEPDLRHIIDSFELQRY